jgi:hypothetical protein
VDASLKREITKDVFGLAAVLIFLATMFLAAFRWSTNPGPIGALGSLPLVLVVVFYVINKYRSNKGDRGHA